MIPTMRALMILPEMKIAAETPNSPAASRLQGLDVELLHWKLTKLRSIPVTSWMKNYMRWSNNVLSNTSVTMAHIS